VVCANTLGVAESRTGDQSITIAHTGDANGKVIEAAQKLFAGIIERHETVAAHYRLLKQTVLSADEFDTLVLDPIAPDPRKHPRWNAEGRMANAVIERAERKWQVVTRLWMSGKGHTGDHSAWEAYNGAVEALDHDTDLFPARSGVYRTASLLGGWLAETKGTVLKGLLAHAESVAASNN